MRIFCNEKDSHIFLTKYNNSGFDNVFGIYLKRVDVLTSSLG